MQSKSGVVMSKSYVIGDMVAAGYNLADIAADGQKYFVFYLPVDYLNSINYDQTYTVTSNGSSYESIVKYIDVESEYTPKDMQTAANKNRESIKIKLLLHKRLPSETGSGSGYQFELEEELKSNSSQSRLLF